MTQNARDEHWQMCYGTNKSDGLEITTGVLDHCAHYYYTDIIFGPKLAVSSDYGAELGCSDLMNFAQYLEVVQARHGSNAYLDVGIGWTRKERWLEDMQTHTLDEVLKQVREAHDASNA